LTHSVSRGFINLDDLILTARLAFVIVLDTVPSNGLASFEFTESFSGSTFTLTDDGVAPASATFTSGTGGFDVEQTPPVAGYDVVWSCTDVNSGSVDGSAVASITVDATEVVTCTLTATSNTIISSYVTLTDTTLLVDNDQSLIAEINENQVQSTVHRVVYTTVF
jgi:hypothetical protein